MKFWPLEDFGETSHYLIGRQWHHHTLRLMVNETNGPAQHKSPRWRHRNEDADRKFFPIKFSKKRGINGQDRRARKMFAAIFGHNSMVTWSTNTLRPQCVSV